MRPRKTARRSAADSSTAQLWWHGLMVAGGSAFGLFAHRLPFGESFLANPIVVFAAMAGTGLLVLRAVLARPVPEVIPERALIVGFAIGIAAYLAGNFVGAHLMR